MKRFNHTLPVTSRTRPGFTLVELLIVITIIVALMALTISASMRFIGISEVRTTETIIQKVHDALDKHWKAVAAKAFHDEQIPETIKDAQGTVRYTQFYTNTLLPLAGGDAHRARVIWTKLRLRQEFPMNFSEITTFTANTLPGLPMYYNAVNGQSGTAEEQSSACLLLALSRARSGIVTNPEDFGAGTIQTFSGRVKGLVDAWGKPIVFTRWPLNLELNGLNPAKTGKQVRFADPQDSDGLLLSPSWYSSSNRSKFESICHQISPDSGKSAWYTVPVVWSYGPDKAAGLPLNFMNGNPTSKDNDNIYSYRLRLGGS